MTDAAAEFNLRIVGPLLEYLRERRGQDAVSALAARAGIETAWLDGRSHWVELSELEAVLSFARAELASDEEFRDACAHGVDRATGTMRLLKGAIGPRDAYDLGARNMPLLTRISRFEPSRDPSGSVVLRYWSQRSESRLMCLSRQGQMIHLPELWGLPPAHLQESKCIAHGDDCCEYRQDVYEPLRWLPIAGGMLLGIVAGIVTIVLNASTVVGTIALLALGAAVGTLLELRRANRLNSRAARAINESTLKLAQDEADARRELLELSARQHEWLARVDEDTGLESQTHGLDEMRARWVTSIRGFTHDLRSPLAVIKTNFAYLRETAALDAEGQLALADIDAAIEQLAKITTSLANAARNDFGAVRLAPEDIDTGTLAEQLRSRARALTHGRDIRVSVLPTREAPNRIRCDRLLLDRVLDNLLTNAAKYTERGSIVVELGGTPGFLTVKISDTGRGIHDQDIERVFEPGGSREDARRGEGWGVGLSVVVQLLSRIGGRLEVMSKPGMGTTFWAHFPLSVPLAPPPSSSERESHVNIARVVSIRRKSA